MKIKVKLEVSQNNSIKNFDLEDLDITESEWQKLSKDEKIELIQIYVNDMPEQPYWMVDSFSKD